MDGIHIVLNEFSGLGIGGSMDDIIGPDIETVAVRPAEVRRIKHIPVPENLFEMFPWRTFADSCDIYADVFYDIGKMQHVNHICADEPVGTCNINCFALQRSKIDFFDIFTAILLYKPVHGNPLPLISYFLNLHSLSSLSFSPEPRLRRKYPPRSGNRLFQAHRW